MGTILDYFKKPEDPTAPSELETKAHKLALAQSGLQVLDHSTSFENNCIFHSLRSAWPEVKLTKKWVNPNEFQINYGKHLKFFFDGDDRDFLDRKDLLNLLDQRCIILLHGITERFPQLQAYHAVLLKGFDGNEPIFEGKHGPFEITQGKLSDICNYYDYFVSMKTLAFSIYRKDL